jgi:hypothetical protein
MLPSIYVADTSSWIMFDALLAARYLPREAQMAPTKQSCGNTRRSNAKDPSPDLSPESEEDSVYDSEAVYGSEDEFEVQGSSDEDGDLLEEQGKDDHDDSLDGGLQSV